MRFSLIIFWFVFSSICLHGQMVNLDVAPRMETESFHRMVKSKNDFYFVRKTKSKEVTKKVFLLSKYKRQSTSEVWQTKVELDRFDNIQNFVAIDDQLCLFISNHDLDSNVATLKVVVFDQSKGYKIAEKVLCQETVATWVDSYGKARVAQSFGSALDARQYENDVTPLEYRYGIEFSQDSSKIAVFTYDNSHEELLLKIRIFNKQLDELHRVKAFIDEGHVSYGLKIDNFGELYLLKVSNQGNLAIVKINPLNEVSAYLTVPVGSTKKVNPRMYIHANHQVYLAYNNTKNGRLVGVTTAVLNFDKESVEDSHYFEFNKETLEGLNGEFSDGAHYFELSEIEEINGKLCLVLEQHRIEGLDVHYEPEATEELVKWHYKPATVITGGMLILLYDKDLSNVRQYQIAKQQKGAVHDGLNTLGHYLDIVGSDVVFVYSNNKKGVANDELYVQILNVDNGNLSHPYKIDLERSHVPVVVSVGVIGQKKLFIHSKKGLLGLKSYLGIYEY